MTLKMKLTNANNRASGYVWTITSEKNIPAMLCSNKINAVLWQWNHQRAPHLNNSHCTPADFTWRHFYEAGLKSCQLDGVPSLTYSPSNKYNSHMLHVKFSSFLSVWKNPHMLSLLYVKVNSSTAGTDDIMWTCHISWHSWRKQKQVLKVGTERSSGVKHIWHIFLLWTWFTPHNGKCKQYGREAGHFTAVEDEMNWISTPSHSACSFFQLRQSQTDHQAMVFWQLPCRLRISNSLTSKKWPRICNITQPLTHFPTWPLFITSVIRSIHPSEKRSH